MVLQRDISPEKGTYLFRGLLDNGVENAINDCPICHKNTC
jgi:hypothetical protein